jgi:MFS family permease
MNTEATPTSVIAVLKRTTPTVRYLLLGAFVNQMGYFIQAYLVVYMLARGFTTLEAGWGLALLSGGAIVGTLAGASLGLRMGNRNAIALSTAALGSSVALVPWLVNTALPLPIWGASIFVTGLFAQMYRPPVATVLSKQMLAEDQVMGFSMYRVAINLGATIGPLLATALSRIDWTWVFWLNAVCSFAYAGIALAKLPHDRPSGQPQGTDQVGESASMSAAWSRVFTDLRFVAFLGAMFLSSVVYIQIYSTLPLAIEAKGLPLDTYSTLLVVSGLIIISFELKVSALVRRLPKWIPATIGTTVLCLGVASFGLSMNSNLLLILSMVILVAGLMTSGPTMFAYPATFPEVIRSKYIGANQAAFSAGNALGPVLGVAMFTQFGGGLWVMCFVLALISGALVVVGMRPVNPPPVQEALST